MIYKITVLNSPGMQSVWMQHKAVPAPARRDCAESAGGNGKCGLVSYESIFGYIAVLTATTTKKRSFLSTRNFS